MGALRQLQSLERLVCVSHTQEVFQYIPSAQNNKSKHSVDVTVDMSNMISHIGLTVMTDYALVNPREKKVDFPII